MPGFKDYLQEDLSTFINPDEFGETHMINGRQMDIVIDNDRLMERAGKEFDSLFAADMLIYVKASDYGEKPEIGTPLKFDTRRLYVTDVKEDAGLYEIILSQTKMG